MTRRPETAHRRAGARAIPVAAFAAIFATILAPAAASAETEAWRATGENRIAVPAVEGSAPKAELFLACVGSILTAGVRIPGENFVGRVAIRYRFDGGPVERDTWQAGQDQQIIQLVGRAAVAPFLARLAQASEFRLVSRAADQAEARFEVAGAQKAAAPVLKACEGSP